MAGNEKNRWLLVALMIGVFLSPINVNFTSVALPTIRDHFEVGVERVSWVGTAYFIPTVVLMPLQTYLAERWGVRQMYVLGLLVLSGAGFASALAPTLEWLLVSRVIQGIGWSALYPLALLLIRTHYPAEKQGTIMGTWESAVGIATIIGPIIAGAIVDFLDWHVVYLVLGLIAALGALVSLVSIPKQDQPITLSVFDWQGALLLTLAALLLLLGVTAKSVMVLAAGGLVFVAWNWQARRVQSAFVDPAILSNMRFMSASTAAMLRMLIGMACLIMLPLFLEDVRGLDSTSVGIVLPVYSVFLFVASRPGGQWSDHAGGRLPSLAGFVLMTLGVAILIPIDARTSLVVIGTALAIRGLGAGISQAPFAQVATGVVTPEQRAAAAGLYGMVRYGGLALGTALVGILLDARFSHYGSDGLGTDAIPAFQELFVIVTVLGGVGCVFSWLMGNQPALQIIRSET
ncbi:MAG: MFS transporter [Anaerolineae bacterium]|nr:MFS transporter [Anaerolineae bacterium]